MVYCFVPSLTRDVFCLIVIHMYTACPLCVTNIQGRSSAVIIRFFFLNFCQKIHFCAKKNLRMRTSVRGLNDT